MERKDLPQFTKEIKDRTVIGIFAVHGNIDAAGDRSHPGSFANITFNGRNRTRFLWQHDSYAPPVAIIKTIKEVDRAGLPDSVLSYAPDATGGVEVEREYLDTMRGNEVLAGIKAGVIDEMSYAYDATKFDFEEIDGQTIRNLREVKLYDVSDVNWGMNPATAGVKGWSGAALTFVEHSEAVGAIVGEYLKRAKNRGDFRAQEGRALSGDNRARIAGLLENLKAVSADLDSILKESQPKPDAATAARTLFIEYQQTIAKLNGVNYAN